MVSFMGHHADSFSPCRLTWVPARDPIVSYAFPWIPMQSHAETHMGIRNRVFPLLVFDPEIMLRVSPVTTRDSTVESSAER